jgi:hypothetical protein
MLPRTAVTMEKSEKRRLIAMLAKIEKNKLEF